MRWPSRSTSSQRSPRRGRVTETFRTLSRSCRNPRPERPSPPKRSSHQGKPQKGGTGGKVRGKGDQTRGLGPYAVSGSRGHRARRLIRSGPVMRSLWTTGRPAKSAPSSSKSAHAAAQVADARRGDAAMDYPGFGNSAMPNPATYPYTLDRLSRAQPDTRFPCHEAHAKGHDDVFTRSAA